MVLFGIFIIHNSPIRSRNQFAFMNKFCARGWLYKSQVSDFIESHLFEMNIWMINSLLMQTINK